MYRVEKNLRSCKEKIFIKIQIQFNHMHLSEDYQKKWIKMIYWLLTVVAMSSLAIMHLRQKKVRDISQTMVIRQWDLSFQGSDRRILCKSKQKDRMYYR